MSTGCRTPCRSRSTRSRNGASVTECSTTCCVACARRRRASRMAPRHPAAGRLGWSQGQGDPGSGRPSSSLRRASTAASMRRQRRRHRPRRRPPADRHGLPGVYGDRVVSVTYSKLGGKHLLEAWIRLLALAADVPGRQWSAVCIGRAKRGADRGGTASWSTRRRTVGSRGRGAARSGGHLRRGTPGTVAIAGEDVVSPGRRPDAATATPNGRLDSVGVPASTRARTRSRPTPGCGASAPRCGPCSPRRDPARSWPASELGWAHSRRDYGCRCCAPKGRAGDGAVRSAWSAIRSARSTTVLEASAGTGKTFALAGSGDPLRRRGRRDAGRDAADHVQPRGETGVA